MIYIGGSIKVLQDTTSTNVCMYLLSCGQFCIHSRTIILDTQYTIRTINKTDKLLEQINKIGAIEGISHMKAD